MKAQNRNTLERLRLAEDRYIWALIEIKHENNPNRKKRLEKFASKLYDIALIRY